MKVKTGFKKMDIFELAAGLLRPRLDRQILVSLLLWLCCSCLASEPVGPDKTSKTRRRPSQGQQYIQQTPSNCSSW